MTHGRSLSPVTSRITCPGSREPKAPGTRGPGASRARVASAPARVAPAGPPAPTASPGRPMQLDPCPPLLFSVFRPRSLSLFFSFTVFLPFMNLILSDSVFSPLTAYRLYFFFTFFICRPRVCHILQHRPPASPSPVSRDGRPSEGGRHRATPGSSRGRPGSVPLLPCASPLRAAPSHNRP